MLRNGTLFANERIFPAVPKRVRCKDSRRMPAHCFSADLSKVREVFSMFSKAFGSLSAAKKIAYLAVFTAIAVAVNALIASGGGFAVACNGGLTDIVPLPVGGIMSDMKFEDLTLALRRIHDSVKLTGCQLESPFLQLAFLPLPVIPFLRITDRGIVDVAEFRIING